MTKQNLKIHVKSENVISGEEAKKAWVNGENVEVKYHQEAAWEALNDDYFLGVFSDDEYSFRLKPRTIIINGIEVPKPQKDSPKKGDDVFTLDFTDNVGGFTSWKCQNSINTFSREWWRTEEEIKQVVAALRKLFLVSGGSVEE